MQKISKIGHLIFPVFQQKGSLFFMLLVFLHWVSLCFEIRKKALKLHKIIKKYSSTEWPISWIYFFQSQWPEQQVILLFKLVIYPYSILSALSQHPKVNNIQTHFQFHASLKFKHVLEQNINNIETLKTMNGLRYGLKLNKKAKK